MNAPVVRLRISVPVLREFLHLDEGVVLAASADAPFGDREDAVTVSLWLRWPGAPEGAEVMEPIYTRHPDGRVELTRIDWYANNVRLP